jgi:peptidyl-prolyl cis-trans isomerase B (cyclophilin B)
MYCSKCGKEHAGPSTLCVECGIAQPTPASPRKGNGLSIASMVLGICGVGLLAFILGLIALKQKREGRGMAIAGVVLGAITTFVPVLVILFATGVFVATSQPRKSQTVRSVELDNPSQFAERMETRLAKVEQRVLKAELAQPDQERFQAELAACRAALARLRESGLSQDAIRGLVKEAHERYRAVKAIAREAGGSSPDSD